MKILKPENIEPKRFTNIIFDWGGVITNINYYRTVEAFANLGHKSFEQFFTQHYQDNLFKDFEVGKIKTEQIIQSIESEIGKKISYSEFETAWCAMLLDTPLSRINLLKELGNHFQLFLLSNTNVIHANYYNQLLQSKYGINFPSLFNKVYYSHEIGFRKPNRDIYEYVLNDKKLVADKTLFIDDTEINIETAVEAGIPSFFLQAPYTIELLFKSWLV